MKLTITVTDDQARIAEDTSLETALAGTTTDGTARPETFDGGPVPDHLLRMEREVAAGQAPAPGTGI
jgi:hypothetical protein